MPFVQVRGLRVHYAIRGAGPRLLYVSGTNGDLRRPPNGLSSPLPGHFEVLAYDQRGLGQTDKPDTPYAMADYADDAAGLLDALGWDRCLLMGVSFGGMVAQELVLRHPERVARLVLACTSAGGAGGRSYPLEELEALPLEERVTRILMIRDARRDAAWQATHRDEFKELVRQALAARELGAGEPGHAIGEHRQLEARAGHDTFERLAGMRIPVYICGGRHDRMAAPVNLEAMHSRIPGSRLEFFEGGHTFLNEDPRAYERAIAFLEDRLAG